MLGWVLLLSCSEADTGCLQVKWWYTGITSIPVSCKWTGMVPSFWSQHALFFFLRQYHTDDGVPCSLQCGLEAELASFSFLIQVYIRIRFSAFVGFSGWLVHIYRLANGQLKDRYIWLSLSSPILRQEIVSILEQ